MNLNSFLLLLFNSFLALIHLLELCFPGDVVIIYICVVIIFMLIFVFVYLSSVSVLWLLVIINYYESVQSFVLL